MTPTEIAEVIALLDADRALRVPFSTKLFPEATADRSELRKSTGGYLLRTYFYDHAPGHGWSREQTEDETLDRAAVERRLGSYERAQITPLG